MLLIYNLIQIFLLLLCLPCLVLVVLIVPKYRGQFLARLGFGLARKAATMPTGSPRIWVHALSVGEVSSARSLVTSLRRSYPQGVIVFTATTRSGNVFASETIGDQVDLVIYGSGERPQLDELGDQLDASLDRLFTMNLVVVPSEREEYVDVAE